MPPAAIVPPRPALLSHPSSGSHRRLHQLRSRQPHDIIPHLDQQSQQHQRRQLRGRALLHHHRLQVLHHLLLQHHNHQQPSSGTDSTFFNEKLELGAA